jgi:PhoH-like ATPase
MIKNYVLDTNVLLHDPQSLFSFQDNRVYIPMPVLEELDRFKKTPGNLGANCREVVRTLDELRNKGNLLEGVPTERGGTVCVKVFQQKELEELTLPSFLKKGLADNWIMLYLMKIQKINPKMMTIFVTKDINFRIKSQIIGIKAQDYLTDKSYVIENKGYFEVTLSEPATRIFKQQNRLSFSEAGIPDIYKKRNVFFDFGNDLYGKSTVNAEEIVGLGVSTASAISGITPRNREQVFALEALLDDEIPLISLTGRSGTGKTLLAIAAGLSKVTEQNAYAKLTVTKPVVSMGQEIGFLPGSAEEKIRPWVQPIYDNLDFLFSKKGIQAEEYLKKKKIIEVEILSYIRGRSIPHHFIIIDEAQNLTPHEIKTIITRAGDKTKIVLTGDPDQIDNPYLDRTSNGLMVIASKFFDHPLAAHITLEKGERSDLATAASEIL